MKIKVLSAMLFASGQLLNFAHAGGTLYPQLETIHIFANTAEDHSGIAHSASQGTITREQLAHRPLLRPAEVLETVPGLIVTQHSGDGKANQYFLRGFNLDHGTDFATTVDGMPLNMVTHAHGQGYTDLNFLIPELIENLHYHKGATNARDGDFASAGSVHLKTVTELDRPFIQATLGSNDYQRVVAAGTTELQSGKLTGGIELLGHDGPWQHEQNLKKQNYLLKYTQGSSKSGWSLTANYYDSEWNSTDQVPQRAIDNNLIGRFGSLDTSDGGETSRTSLAFEKVVNQEDWQTQFNLYGIHSKLNLFSNFTYYLTDAKRGDQFEQAEDRYIVGGAIEHSWLTHWQDRHVINLVGASTRYDDIDGLGLYQTQYRQRFNTIREDQVKEYNVGLWGQNQVQWTPWLKSILGLRADYFNFDVDSDLAANSGKTDDYILSPKLNLVFGPWANTEYYVNYAYGFHSNDARGATIQINPDPRDEAYLQAIDPVDPLVRTKNAEIGIRGQWLPNLSTTFALWQLDSDSELLFVGDAGTTEASRPSRRQGIEFSNFYQPNEHWMIDVDLAWSKARYKDHAEEGRYIPGAINKTASAGVIYTPAQPWSLGLRMRYFGPRSLIENNSVKSSSSTLVNLQAGYQFSKNLEAKLDVLNLFNRKVNDIEYWYESCLANDLNMAECDPLSDSREGILDKHVHSSEDRSYRFTVKYTF